LTLEYYFQRAEEIENAARKTTDPVLKRAPAARCALLPQ
jgi:hypothetical protein